jgi:hypothetical protein
MCKTGKAGLRRSWNFGCRDERLRTRDSEDSDGPGAMKSDTLSGDGYYPDWHISANQIG